MRLYINQMGYLPGSRKTAVIAADVRTSPDRYGIKIRILDEGEHCVLEKAAKLTGEDPASGDLIWQADFSELEAEGSYRLQARTDPGEKETDRKEGSAGVPEQPLTICGNLYEKLLPVLCRTFYYQRCGMELEEAYAGVFHRKSCHKEMARLLTNYKVLEEGGEAVENLPRVDVSGGWHDAGDYGRYTSAAATALAHLLYAWEWYPGSFRGGFHIPESGGPMADILSECRYELEWLLKMQREDGGVNHKVTSIRHACFVMPERDCRPLFLFPVSSAATAAFSAVMALAFRTYESCDPPFARRALSAARRAWDWLEGHPALVEFHNPKGCNTGEYDDPEDWDERLWAAAELYAAVKEPVFLERAYELEQKREREREFGLGWRNVEGFAAFSILREEIQKSGNGGAGRKKEPADEARRMAGPGENRSAFWEAELKKTYKRRILEEARTVCRLCRTSGYLAALKPEEFGWGSNMVPAVRGMILSAAYALSGNREFWEAAGMQMDYLLGVNALGYSYITGIGQKAVRRPHNRILEADGIEEPIPGYVSGGPNPGCQDDKAGWMMEPDTPPMKCFLDLWECYSLNETAIYWNSPVVFLTAFLCESMGENP